jgi:hypothetical protein
LWSCSDVIDPNFRDFLPKDVTSTKYQSLYQITCLQVRSINEIELESSGTFVDRVDVFFGGIKVVECSSKNEIRSRSLLDDVCFGFFIGVLLIYDTFIL